MRYFTKIANRYRTTSTLDDKMSESSKKKKGTEETASNITETNLDTGEVVTDHMSETRVGNKVKSTDKTVVSNNPDGENLSEGKTTKKNRFFGVDVGSQKTTYNDEEGNTFKKKTITIGDNTFGGKEKSIKGKKHQKHLDSINKSAELSLGQLVAIIAGAGGGAYLLPKAMKGMGLKNYIKAVNPEVRPGLELSAERVAGGLLGGVAANEILH